ncbi:hypothetical protein C8R45DRAFT_1165685 [Mycena sanguinolenta]|nr:hypothetical protein C8R45DRAFT_1165685 [Mycena sanguinolenta]
MPAEDVPDPPALAAGPPSAFPHAANYFAAHLSPPTGRNPVLHAEPRMLFNSAPFLPFLAPSQGYDSPVNHAPPSPATAPNFTARSLTDLATSSHSSFRARENSIQPVNSSSVSAVDPDANRNLRTTTSANSGATNSGSGELHLREYVGSVPTHLIDPTIQLRNDMLRPPTFKPYIKLLRDKPHVLERRNALLEAGAHAFAKHFLLDTAVSTRKLLIGPFMNELITLDQVLTSIEVVQLLDGKTSVYRLQRAPFWMLEKQLDNLRRRAQNAFDHVYGLPMPTMPTWGRNEDPFAFHAINEFEVLAVCYRVEVENYISILDLFFDFSAKRIRLPNEELERYYDKHCHGIWRPGTTGALSFSHAQDNSLADSSVIWRSASTPGASEGGSPTESLRQDASQDKPRLLGEKSHKDVQEMSYCPKDKPQTLRNRGIGEDSSDPEGLPNIYTLTPETSSSLSHDHLGMVDDLSRPVRCDSTSLGCSWVDSRFPSSAELSGTHYSKHFESDTGLRWVRRVNLMANNGLEAWKKRLGKPGPCVLRALARNLEFNLHYARHIRNNWNTMGHVWAPECFLSAKWPDESRRILQAKNRPAVLEEEESSEYFIRTGSRRENTTGCGMRRELIAVMPPAHLNFTSQPRLEKLGGYTAAKAIIMENFEISQAHIEAYIEWESWWKLGLWASHAVLPLSSITADFGSDLQMAKSTGILAETLCQHYALPVSVDSLCSTIQPSSQIPSLMLNSSTVARNDMPGVT